MEDYNGIVGFISSMLFVCLTFLIGDIFNMKITLIIIFFIFAIILIPVNIYIMKKGKIIAKGTHNELIENCDFYKSLYSSSN